MSQDQKKNNFDLNQWVPPNPLVHEMKVKKELLSLGDEAKWFCITRWLNLNIFEKTDIYFKNFPKMHIGQTVKTSKEEMTHPYTIILKMYFKVTKEIEFKTFKIGFRNKEGKVYPRLGVKLPEKVFIECIFPNMKDKPTIRKDLQEKILNQFKVTNILGYFPSREKNFDENNAHMLPNPGLPSNGIINRAMMIGQSNQEESDENYALLTEKNWSIIQEDINTEKYIEYINGMVDTYPGHGIVGYYEPYYMAECSRTVDREINEPDIDTGSDSIDAIEYVIGGTK